mgnify:CR=1 FL=1
MMSQTKVNIISNAFVLLGKNPIVAIDSSNPAQSAVSTLYDALLLNELTRGQPWRFSIGTQELTRTNDTPINGWLYEYQLPSNFLRLVRTYNNSNAVISYDLYQDRILTNSTVVKVDFIFKVNESLFPPYFYMLMVYDVAAHIAMTITQDVTIVKIWQDAYKEQKLVAEYIDSITTPNLSFAPGQIYQARASGVTNRALY